MTLLSSPYGGIPSLNKALDPMLVIVCYYLNMVLFERNAPFFPLGYWFYQCLIIVGAFLRLFVLWLISIERLS